MLDIKFIRQNPDAVRENIKKKFQNHKLELVDDVLLSDEKYRIVLTRVEELRSERNSTSKHIGKLMSQGLVDDANEAKAKVTEINTQIAELEVKSNEYAAEVKSLLMQIPQMLSPDVPVGKNDEENVERERFGEAAERDFEIPFHTQILESFAGLDIESARRVAGTGFYYLNGDVARIHSAILSFARDFMIERGFIYVIPPYMIRGDVLSGVMAQADAETMAYKIEGEDLYLIGTSEHSMIGRFIGELIPETELPCALTSYSPCFRKEVGAHGMEERGIYRVHQFEKQEMVVICHPNDSENWYERLWKNSVEFFRALDIPVRTLECCSGDLADIKVRSVDIEAWSPRQKKYFEVGSCSNIGDAQSRRLGIRIKKADGSKYLPHTLNNTVVAPPRMLIAFFENNLQKDGSVNIPVSLRAYLGGMDKLVKRS